MAEHLDIALTFDVEFNKPSIIRQTGSLYSGLIAMMEALDVCAAHGVPGTWLIAHDLEPENQIARLFPKLVDRMGRQGEIGCHFHFHEARVSRTDEGFQRAGIGEATRYLRSLGHAVTSFRGGNCYLDPTTLRILEDLGYTVDSSVVPGLREVSPEGLVTDHKARRRSDPYFPRAAAPWEAGGSGILEVPLSTEILLDFRTPLVSLLINRVIGINNRVLSDPDRTAGRIGAITAKERSERMVMALSAHPYDFLPGPIPAGRKLLNLDRFLSLMKAVPGAAFTTLSGIRARWAAAGDASGPARSLITVTTSDLRRLRNGMRRALGVGRAILGGARP